ncbi:uncharacterized protein K02A2.6-like [Corticium candelabrum]|uniref:uncharacterized protein K02A2.6-like n=1 Tax=Corticium candelabrum TaxID=121492 RepID=UPI002E26F133|nr:uncharacterized protein K02A2.6-like [Corticium candelabrum]
MARSHILCIQLNAAIEDIAQFCNTCQQSQPNPTSFPLDSWSWPNNPWHRVHIDFAKLDGADFLILVDSHSKWMEAIHMSHSTTARSTIQALRKMFARYDLPAELVSDNGLPFTSEEFATFMKQNGIRSIRSPPFHPATNGLVERVVRSFESGMKNQPYAFYSTSWQRGFYITGQLRTPLLDNCHASS